MDSVLSNLLLDQHAANSYSLNGWKAPTITAVISAIKRDCDVTITKDTSFLVLKLDIPL